MRAILRSWSGPALRFLVPVLTVLSLQFPGRAARAQLVDFTWGAAELVDAGAIDLSSAAGKSVVGLPDGTGRTWDLVYLKDGRVRHIARNGGIWGASEALSPEGVTARNPQIARTAAVLHVVWEDDRSGHPEIYTRRQVGGAWGAEECVTCDAARSAAPSMEGDDTQAFLAWEDGNIGATRVLLSVWNGSAWSVPGQVSPDGSAAFDPSVSCWGSGFSSPAVVAWADSRHGTSEIYLRKLDGTTWEPERLVASMAGNCRKPSLTSEVCCGDFLTGAEQIAFLNDNGGITTPWSACYQEGGDPYLQQVSSSPTQSVAAGGFSFDYSPPGPFGGPIAFDLLAWGEGPAGLPRSVFVRSFSGCGPRTPVLLTDSALDGPVVAAVEGNPLAGGIVVWTEPEGSGRRLMAALGTVPGCEHDRLFMPSALLLAPEGVPGDTIRVFNDCTGEFIIHPQGQAQIRFDAELDGAITWDPLQMHPNTGYINPDGSGAFVFNIRGGRCIPNGHAYLYLNGVALRYWDGVRSPDVDGDCVVGESDRSYVQTRLGTSDLCADLDGSGLVDESDLAILDAAYGDLCSHLVGVGEQPAAASGRFDLRIGTNPVVGRAILRFELATAAQVSVVVVDIGGRAVRDLGTLDLAAGTSIVSWNRLDAAGRPAAPGIYFVVARSEGRTVQRRLILLD